jgi:hypothetical protein
MIHIYSADVLGVLPHPTLTQFDEQPLIDWVLEAETPTHASKCLLKYYYFYRNTPHTPILIAKNGNHFEVHPGNKRFMGSSLKNPGHYMSAYIVSADQLSDMPGMKLQYIGGYDEPFIGNGWLVPVEDQYEQLARYVPGVSQAYEGHKEWVWKEILPSLEVKGSYGLILPSGKTIFLNIHGQDTGIRIKVLDYPSLYDALRALYESVDY